MKVIDLIDDLIHPLCPHVKFCSPFFPLFGCRVPMLLSPNLKNKWRSKWTNRNLTKKCCSQNVQCGNSRTIPAAACDQAQQIVEGVVDMQVLFGSDVKKVRHWNTRTQTASHVSRVRVGSVSSRVYHVRQCSPSSNQAGRVPLTVSSSARTEPSIPARVGHYHYYYYFIIVIEHKHVSECIRNGCLSFALSNS